MKIFKKKVDPRKEFLLQEIATLESYMHTVGQGSEEYDALLSEWQKLNEELNKKGRFIKADTVLKGLEIGVIAVGSIFVPMKLGKLAYKKENEEGDFKNGTTWSIATKKVK